MIDSYFRTAYQEYMISPLLPSLSKLKCSPHAFTLGALIAGVGVAPALYYERPYLAVSLLVLSGLFDTLDGSFARFKCRPSPQGAVLDLISDRMVETSVILGLFLVSPQERGFLCLLMLGTALICVTSFLAVGIFIPNQGEKSFHYSPGLIERTEAFIFFAALILFPSLFVLLAILFSVLVMLTAVMRVFQFVAHL